MVTMSSQPMALDDFMSFRNDDGIKALRLAKEQAERAERENNSILSIIETMRRDSLNAELQSKIDLVYDNHTGLSQELKFSPNIYNCGNDFDIYKLMEQVKAQRKVCTEPPKCVEDILNGGSSCAPPPSTTAGTCADSTMTTSTGSTGASVCTVGDRTSSGGGKSTTVGKTTPSVSKTTQALRQKVFRKPESNKGPEQEGVVGNQIPDKQFGTINQPVRQTDSPKKPQESYVPNSTKMNVQAIGSQQEIKSAPKLASTQATNKAVQVSGVSQPLQLQTKPAEGEPVPQRRVVAWNPQNAKETENNVNEKNIKNNRPLNIQKREIPKVEYIYYEY